MNDKALSQEPCDDAISREWLMRKATERFYTTNYFNHISAMIEEAPSVTQKSTECDDAISRDAVLICLTGEFEPDKKYEPEKLIELFSKRIKQLPPVTQKSGKWIDTDNYYQRWKCSECGYHTRDAEPNFCPNCGAKMESEE